MAYACTRLSLDIQILISLVSTCSLLASGKLRRIGRLQFYFDAANSAIRVVGTRGGRGQTLRVRLSVPDSRLLASPFLFFLYIHDQQSRPQCFHDFFPQPAVPLPRLSHCQTRISASSYDPAKLVDSCASSYDPRINGRQSFGDPFRQPPGWLQTVAIFEDRPFRTSFLGSAARTDITRQCHLHTGPGAYQPYFTGAGVERRDVQGGKEP